MTRYPYDPEVLATVADVLYRALPALYRTEDQPPRGRANLRAFLDVLAAPLAVVRQNIEELHADLFIDTASDEAVPLLAEMVGTTLVFPDAASNRRDVRGTVGWRRRKGTPRALREMAEDLTGQLVVMQEGWQRLILFQDLDFPRPLRVVPDVRPATLAEAATGPLDAAFHAVDLRAIGAHTGRYHPRHVTYWLHPTFTAPLSETTAVDLSVPGSEPRFAMNPLGVREPLRARRAGGLSLRTDRVPEQAFAADPGTWFGVDGRFTISVCGLPAGVAGEAADTARRASELPASLDVARGAPSLVLLDRPARRFHGAVRIEIGTAPVTLTGPATWQPDTAGYATRAAFEIAADGAGPVAAPGGEFPAGDRTVLVRLSPVGGAVGRLFAGAVIEIAGGAPAAVAASTDAELARTGFLRGALLATVPALSIVGERWLHLAADGSLYDAHDGDAAAPLRDMPRVGATRRLDPAALLAAGTPAWPPTPEAAEPTMLSRLPAALRQGPTVMHGGAVLRRAAGNLIAGDPAATCHIVFAAALAQPGGASYRPFQRLSWTGTDPATATWRALGADGAPVGADAASVSAEYAAVVRLARDNRAAIALAVRFECSGANATIAPAEVAWTSYDGRTVLIHLPQLDVAPVAGTWPAAEAFVSDSIRVGEDGSTWDDNSTARRRASLGNSAPIHGGTALRRRTVVWRRLCPWINKDWAASPPRTLSPTRPGRLDVDVLNGLFAFAAEEPPQSFPQDAAGNAPPSVTSSHEVGTTMHIGARPAAREPVLDARLATPTRLVTRSGRLSANAPAEWLALPRHASLTEAFAAIDAEWTALTADEVAARPRRAEVIEIEDSATYPGETPVWPSGPADAELSLTVQAAERERPIILLEPTAGSRADAALTYAAVTLIGLAVGAKGATAVALPPARTVDIALSTLLFADNRLHIVTAERGTAVRIRLSEAAGITVDGTASLEITDSIVDAGEGAAIDAPSAAVSLERASVGGTVTARVAEASDVIFRDDVVVEDRFHGCVRYSRVTSGSVLPRVFRIARDVPIRVVSSNRRDAAWWRLAEDCDAAIARGTENGSEMGVFHQLRSAERLEAFRRRQTEFTPAGLVSGIVRLD